MYIFSGSVSKQLAESLARELSWELGTVEKKRFKNDEMRIYIPTKHIGESAVVVQSLVSPVEENLVEFCFMCDALRRLGVTKITGIIPWLGYSKQDKVFRPGEALSVKVIAKMLQVVPLEHLYTFDLHNLAILGFFDVPVTNISARNLFLDYFRKQEKGETVIVAPDAGAVKSSTSFAGELGRPVVYVDKKRDLATGEVTIAGMSGSVKGKNIIIVDDMIVTGSTLVEVASYLKTQGAATISVVATHHLYVAGSQEAIEKSGIDTVIVTDTVTPKIKSSHLVVLSVAPLLAQELKHAL